MRWLAVIALAFAVGCTKDGCACKAKPAPVAAVTPVAKPEPLPPIPPAPTPVDVPLDAAISIDATSMVDAGPADPVASRLPWYATLVAYDLSIESLLERFPGAPTTSTFDSKKYGWPESRVALTTMITQVTALLKVIDSPPTIAADAPVRAYVELLARELEALRSLHTYYYGKEFIDDDFDRGRKASPDVKRIADELTAKRGAMRAAIFAVMNDGAGHADSPRAIISQSWRSCMMVADRLRAKPPDLPAAMSVCRRSLQTLTRVPEAVTGTFQKVMRIAAAEIGDSIARGIMWWSFEDAIRESTFEYARLFPKLPRGLAERPPAPAEADASGTGSSGAGSSDATGTGSGR